MGAAAFVVLALTAAFARKIGAIFIVAAVTVFGFLRLTGSFVMVLASRAPRTRTRVMRLAMSNIFRRGAWTPTVVMSLGLGLALLVAVLEVDANLSRQFAAAIPERAPSFYFIDIPSDIVERFDAFMQNEAPRAKLERVPMLRGRIVSARGVPADDLKPKPEAAWVLQSDSGMTYTAQLPAGSALGA